ncbi:peptidase inhibitor family I36 protein [Streptomyces sp. 549]|uniref:peptidase inhibitor family I36 protein n=1 Tax=Streptomyces sp. 549 TaxID=3049076 RepID=UPI0032E35C11
MPVRRLPPQPSRTARGASRAALPSVDAPRLGPCETGRLCLWTGRGFTGRRHTFAPRKVAAGECVTLPAAARSAAVANRTGRPVTTYRSEWCAETADFRTYPSGTWAPDSPHVVRAFKVWER